MTVHLITGGCGFIGSHLAHALVERGIAVRVLDDLSNGDRDNLPPGVELLVGDVRDAAAVRRAMAGADACYHLAAIASVIRSNEEWLDTNHVNLGGTIQVLEAAWRQGAAEGRAIPVVYASSAAVYGDNPSLPLAETATPQPLTAYGADKLASEHHARVAALIHGVPTVGLRLFNVYGPRQDPHSPYSGVISCFIGRILEGVALEIHGDGMQGRDFIYVGDVVRLLERAMALALADAGAGLPRSHVFNGCTGEMTTISRLAEELAHLSGQLVPVVHAPARSGDIRFSRGDPRQAAARLGLRAETGLRDGLRRTLAHWRQKGQSVPPRGDDAGAASA